METKIIALDIAQLSERGEWLSEAAALLRCGEVIAFPTETVYGLGANALNPDACRKIFEIKGRPADNPLIVHIATIDEAKQMVRKWPQEAELCAKAFWPGPLTLVLEKQKIIPEIVSGGLDTVAVRMPAHPIALALIKATGFPLAAPSANISGKPSPTEGKHVFQDLNGKIPLLIDAGKSAVGLESTVLDLSGDIPTILRPGGVTAEQIEEILGSVRVESGIEIDKKKNNCKNHHANTHVNKNINNNVNEHVNKSLNKNVNKHLINHVDLQDDILRPKSPGMKYKHYAPEGEIILLSGSTTEKDEKIYSRIKNKKPLQKFGIICMEETAAEIDKEILKQAQTVFILGSWKNLASSASRLFEGLRKCDEEGIDIIFAEEMPAKGIGFAFMNRLKKAAGKI